MSVNKTTTHNVDTSQQRLDTVMARLRQAVAKHGSTAVDVKLLAVSKTFPAQAVIDFVRCGQLSFGENYVQEACEKIVVCRELLANESFNTKLEWHFIGPLQSNKTRQVAEHFDWVQSIERLKIAQRLSEQRPPQIGPLNVCVQVNVSGEESKSGCNPNEALELANQIMQLPNLRLRGLMAIPEAIVRNADQTNNLPSLEAQFEQMQSLYKQLKVQASENTKESDQIDTLSLGMSGDLELAIDAGSTMVRIGSALFGARV
jgi:PLP dependent protein